MSLVLSCHVPGQFVMQRWVPRAQSLCQATAAIAETWTEDVLSAPWRTTDVLTPYRDQRTKHPREEPRGLRNIYS